MLDAVLTLARRLNMSTVAEGVETPEQAAWLREHGVNFLQGYWISRPMPLAQFREWRPDISPGVINFTLPVTSLIIQLNRVGL